MALEAGAHGAIAICHIGRKQEHKALASLEKLVDLLEGAGVKSSRFQLVRGFSRCASGKKDAGKEALAAIKGDEAKKLEDQIARILRGHARTSLALGHVTRLESPDGVQRVQTGEAPLEGVVAHLMSDLGRGVGPTQIDRVGFLSSDCAPGAALESIPDTEDNQHEEQEPKDRVVLKLATPLGDDDHAIVVGRRVLRGGVVGLRGGLRHRLDRGPGGWGTANRSRWSDTDRRGYGRGRKACKPEGPS